MLEDPWRAPDPAMFQRTKDPRHAPDAPRVIEIEYDRGDAVALDGQRLSAVDLLAKLNQIAGEHGVGRVDLVENRFVGMKSRGVYETPGGSVLHAARAAVESLTLDRELVRLRHDLMPRYAALVYNGFWFSPERETLQRHGRRHRTGDHRDRAAPALQRLRSPCSGARRHAACIAPTS